MSIIFSPEIYPITMPRTLPAHDSLNNDIDLRKRVTKYFYYKLLDNWLLDELSHLLTLLQIKDGKVSLVDDISLYKKGKPESPSDRELKIYFLKEYFITKKYIFKLLERLIIKSKYNWYDLYNNELLVKSYLRYKLKKKLMKAIEETK